MFEGGTLQGVIGGLMSESIEDIYLRTMWLVLHTIRICLLVGAHLVTIQASYGCVIAWINCCESWGFFWGGGVSLTFSSPAWRKLHNVHVAFFHSQSQASMSNRH